MTLYVVQNDIYCSCHFFVLVDSMARGGTIAKDSLDFRQLGLRIVGKDYWHVNRLLRAAGKSGALAVHSFSYQRVFS